mgnify:CR=1 FL=1
MLVTFPGGRVAPLNTLAADQMTRLFGPSLSSKAYGLLSHAGLPIYVGGSSL